jgi:hypothetical protein
MLKAPLNELLKSGMVCLVVLAVIGGHTSAGQWASWRGPMMLE